MGDATNPPDIARLMAGDPADLIFTDPPYNVNYEGHTENRLKIQRDRMTDEQFNRFLKAAFRSCRAVVKPGASLYVCHSSSWQREFQNALETAGFDVRCQVIWAKNTFAWGFGRYKFRHEPIFYAHVAGQSDAWYGDKSQSTLWEENKPAANRLHPTMKPVELIERAILNSSKAGDVVGDLFGGSGSTLIACAGLALGLIGAYWAGHAMQSVLFGVPAIDVSAFGATGLALLWAALCACYLPALRAASVEIMRLLRNE